MSHSCLPPLPLSKQTRAEALGAALAAVAFITPSIEQRLKELEPGRGRAAAAASVPGASSVFALPPDAPEAVKQVHIAAGEVHCCRCIACQFNTLPNPE